MNKSRELKIGLTHFFLNRTVNTCICNVSSALFPKVTSDLCYRFRLTSINMQAQARACKRAHVHDIYKPTFSASWFHFHHEQQV